MSKEQIAKIIDLLDYLDGRGIVFEDEDLVRKTLQEINPALYMAK